MRNKIFFFLILFFLNGYTLPVYSADLLRILAIRVEFVEDDATTTIGNGKFDLSEPSHLFQIDPPPHNRSYFEDHILFLSNYFKKVSKERLIISGDVFPLEETRAYQLDEPMTRYNPNRTPEENNRALAELFRDAIQKADQDSEIDFSRYDGFIIFHAGVGKDVDVGFDETPQDIPSLYITPDFLNTYLRSPGVSVDNGNVMVSGGILAPETESQEGIELGLNGILTSNMGSLLGWLDLFSPETRRSGIGRFGLMDVGLFNGDGLLPAIPCAWTRLEAGWETVRDIITHATGDVFEVSSPLSSHPAKVYRIPINRNEYFLVENRYSGELNFDSLQYEISRNRPEFATAREVLETYYEDQITFSSTGVLTDVQNPDIGLPGSGSLIWHIDENIIAQNRSLNRINADPEHRGVDLEEADGSQDIGEAYDFLSPGYGSEIGYLLDMWFEGNSSPIFQNSFSPKSIPPSLSYYNRANSHIKIYDFSDADSVMTFRVNFDFFQEHFPLLVDAGSAGQMKFIKSSDIDYNGTQDLILASARGELLVLNSSNAGADIDSVIAASIGAEIAAVPVLFDNLFYPGVSKIKSIIFPDITDRLWGFVFLQDGRVDTLFSPFTVNSAITTHPVAFYQEPDSAVTVVMGLQEGTVFRMTFSASGMDTSRQHVGEGEIVFVHVKENGEIISIVRNNNGAEVYRNDTFLRNSDLPISPPVGNFSAGVTGQGNFLLLEEQTSDFSENGLFHFSSPIIVNPFDAAQPGKSGYILAGNNRLFSYNYNFTLKENFPVRISDPDQEREIPFSPLVNRFYTSGAAEDYGILVADVMGVIDGYDMKGNRLDDFPLSAGETFQFSPVVLDFDGDGDLELAALTVGNELYMWDFASQFDQSGWNQLYADELNSNRNPNPIIAGPGTTPAGLQENDLMPEDMVYNWPNPNKEDFTFIRYFLSEPARVTIKIFDMAGDLVDEFSGTGDSQSANEVRWDLSGIQSGVYLGRIEAEANGKSEVRIIKIAVVK